MVNDGWLKVLNQAKKNSLIMFEGGLRICLGIKFTMIELVWLVALLFENMKTETGFVLNYWLKLNQKINISWVLNGYIHD